MEWWQLVENGPLPPFKPRKRGSPTAASPGPAGGHDLRDQLEERLLVTRRRKGLSAQVVVEVHVLVLDPLGEHQVDRPLHDLLAHARGDPHPAIQQCAVLREVGRRVQQHESAHRGAKTGRNFLRVPEGRVRRGHSVARVRPTVAASAVPGSGCHERTPYAFLARVFLAATFLAPAFLGVAFAALTLRAPAFRRGRAFGPPRPSTSSNASRGIP